MQIECDSCETIISGWFEWKSAENWLINGEPISWGADQVDNSMLTHGDRSDCRNYSGSATHYDSQWIMRRPPQIGQFFFLSRFGGTFHFSRNRDSVHEYSRLFAEGIQWTWCASGRELRGCPSLVRYDSNNAQVVGYGKSLPGGKGWNLVTIGSLMTAFLIILMWVINMIEFLLVHKHFVFKNVPWRSRSRFWDLVPDPWHALVSRHWRSWWINVRFNVIVMSLVGLATN